MSKVLKIILILLILFAVAIGIIFKFIYPLKVVGSAMSPNYKDGQYLVSNRLAYKLSIPQRGDVVTFLAPPDHNVEFIKRIIGLPGEKIKIDKGMVYLNDQKLEESYLSDGSTVGGTFLDKEDVSIPLGKYVVMGDNRAHSLDSRTFGFISTNEITGKVWFCYFNCSN